MTRPIRVSPAADADLDGQAAFFARIEAGETS